MSSLWFVEFKRGISGMTQWKCSIFHLSFANDRNFPLICWYDSAYISHLSDEICGPMLILWVGISRWCLLGFKKEASIGDETELSFILFVGPVDVFGMLVGREGIKLTNAFVVKSILLDKFKWHRHVYR